VRAVGSGTGTIYGTITAVAFSTNTTVTVVWDSGSLSNETLTICISQIPRTGGPAAPVSTRQVLTSGSAATYTTPGGVRQLRIRMYGGGGGGGGGGDSGVNGGVGGFGGDTIFNSIHAKGGSPGGGGIGAQGSNGGAGGVAGTGSASVRIAGQFGGPGTGAPNPTISSADGGVGGGSGGGGPGTINGAANTGGGGGGGAVSGTATGGSGGGGGQGEYAELIINSPSATYTYTVGADGSSGIAGSGGGAGGTGGSGVIIVDEFY
jgi:hypothetical protein